MPKVKLSESRQKTTRVRKNLLLLQGKKTNSEMGRYINKSKNTYKNRLTNPEELTLEEITLLCARFNIEVKRFIEEELDIN